MSLEDAVVLGAKYQLRPRLILILVAMLGMVPAATAVGIGSDDLGHRSCWGLALDAPPHAACPTHSLLPG